MKTHPVKKAPEAGPVEVYDPELPDDGLDDEFGDGDELELVVPPEVRSALLAEQLKTQKSLTR